jgi:hypothetical protein
MLFTGETEGHFEPPDPLDDIASFVLMAVEFISCWIYRGLFTGLQAVSTHKNDKNFPYFAWAWESLRKNYCQ